MTEPRTAHSVFVDAVQDELNGTPNASHPVQFVNTSPGSHFVVCTLCGSTVPRAEEWRDLHRKNHDDHNKVHAAIEHEARRYKSPPRYG